MKLDLKHLVMYAGASQDFNEIHYNFDVAKKAGFPRPIVHGMLTMALCIKEALKHINAKPENIKKVKARFINPILLEEEITFEVKEESQDKKIITVICKKENGEIATECKVELK